VGWLRIGENGGRRVYGRLGGGKDTKRARGLHVGVARGMCLLCGGLWLMLLLVEMKKKKKGKEAIEWKRSRGVCN
jgi:hypothetical protein